MMINIIATVYGALCVIALLVYIPKIKQFFYMSKKPKYKIAKKQNKISLVIPARKESEVIVDLFDSILRQTYKNFDVNVIVDDVNDLTVKLAGEIGANVFVVENQKCKGDALDGYFKSLTPEKLDGYDAFVIIDADAVLSPDYVYELNNALEHDCQIFLSRKDIKNYLGMKKLRSLHCNCSVMTYPQLDDLANSYRTAKGIPMNMCGQGMMLRTSVIKELGGWPYRTLTEDYELRMDCFLKGFTSMYYPYAVIYTEEAVTHKDSYKRRLRWVTGFSQCDRKYKKQIKKAARERGKTTEGEFEYFYSLVPLIFFIAVTFLTSFTGIGLTVYYAVTGGEWLKSLLLLAIMPYGIMYTLEFIYGAMCMYAYRDVFEPLSAGEKIAALLYEPIFMFEYFPLFIQSRFCSLKGFEWQPTKHLTYCRGKAAERAASKTSKLKRARIKKSPRKTSDVEVREEPLEAK